MTKQSAFPAWYAPGSLFSVSRGPHDHGPALRMPTNDGNVNPTTAIIRWMSAQAQTAMAGGTDKA